MTSSELERLTTVEIGGRIRRWRERRGMTQTTLGEKIGVSQVQVSSLERAYRDLRVTTALEIAAALGVTLQTLVTKDPT
ncbi:hypothetical protein LCGC14_0443510 [marine sediment metagenome]|uniref:HTH cro/C1-type domain-containing protein n=1 Tax=marine sediment metagenome TaxID=412755 RepID=A0A0F9SJN7_9ZZZZ